MENRLVERIMGFDVTGVKSRGRPRMDLMDNVKRAIKKEKCLWSKER